MVNLTKFQEYLATTATSIDSDEFLKIHRYLEGYLRRLLFICLRVNNVKYVFGCDRWYICSVACGDITKTRLER